MIFLLIGALLMLLGKNDYGEKHSKFIYYAVIFLIIYIIVIIVLSSISTLASFNAEISQFPFTSQDTSEIINSHRTTTLISAASGIIGSVLGGLIWFFGLYQLENKTGRNILYAAFVCMIVTAVIVSMSSILLFEEYSLCGNSRKIRLWV